MRMVKNKSIKLNLGSGTDYIDGWVNVDIDTKNKVDVIADLNKKFPFKDNTVDEIKASDILEHFTKEDGEKFLKECHRVLKRGGIMIIRTHNIFQVFSQFKNDPLVLIHFLYGDTKQTDIFGTHKYAYTKDSFNLISKKVGFEIISFEDEETNFKIIVEKIIKPEKKLNIGIIMQSPDIGGAEIYMLSLIDEFIKKGNKILLASNKEKFLIEAKKLNIKTYEIPFVMDIIGNYRGLIKTILLLPFETVYYVNLLYSFKTKKIDVILMSNFTEKLFISILSVFFRIPVVWIEYGRLSTVFKRNFYIPKISYRLLRGIPKQIIVPSKNTSLSLITDARVSLSKIIIVPPGIKEEKSSKNEFLNEWSGNFIIGSVSRLAREKGQEYLINSMPYILKKVPSARLLIIGDGPDKIYFEKLITSLGLVKKIKITGFVKDLSKYYSRMDVFVFPTVWDLEGFGLVLIEAMSHKLPVIANNIGPVPEIIQDGKNGILVDVKNKRDFSDAIVFLAKNPKKKQKMGENGYNKFKDRYTLEKSSSSILKVLYEAAIY